MADKANLVEGIGRIYGAAAEPAHWPATLNYCASLLGADAAGFFAIDPIAVDGGFHFNTGIRVSIPDHARYQAQDPRLIDASTRPPGAIYTDLRVDVFRRFLASETYACMYRPLGLKYLIGARLTVTDRRSAALGFHRATAGRPFDRREFALFRRLMPHFTRAAALHRHLSDLRAVAAAGAAATNAMRTGVIFISAEGRILWANDAAEVVLARADGLRVVSGRLEVGHLRDGDALRALISEASGIGVDSRGGSMRLPRPSGLRPYGIVVAPMRLRVTPIGTGVEPAAVLFLTDDERIDDVQLDVATELFRLTPAERRVAARLLVGDTLSDAASRLGISVETARSHAKRLLWKTGARSRAELMRNLVVLPRVNRNRNH